MNDAQLDGIIADVLKGLGVEPDKQARWLPYYYFSKAAPPIGGKRQDGWICSHCGKHSYRKASVCDGCKKIMTNPEVAAP